MIAQGPVQISQVVRNAVQFNARRWSNPAMNSDLMPHAVGDLFGLLDRRGIDYVLVGGIALLSYVEGRNTEDIDLIVAVAALLYYYQPDQDAILRELAGHLIAGDLAEIRSILTEIGRRILRFDGQ